jgi:fructose-1,6-bisphosphatase/inositol monophosphatase family enzyme
LLTYLGAGDPQFGIISMPSMNEIYFRIKGGKVRLEGNDIHVSSQNKLKDGTLSVTTTELHTRLMEIRQI